MPKSSKKAAKKTSKKSKKEEVEEDEDEESGMSLDDAFGDDEDVEYAEAKPQKIKKKKEEDDEDFEEEGDEVEGGKVEFPDEVEIKASKPIEKIKKGDKIKIDGRELEVDAHYILIDHGTSKEMAIDVFDPKKEEDFEIRYFNNRIEGSIEVFKLDEIIYNRLPVKKIEW